MSKQRIFLNLATFMLYTLLASACGIDKSEVEYKYPKKVMGRDTMTGPEESERETIFGKGGIKLFGGGESESANANGIGVNSFLWRACLDTLSFMPLSSADAFGGVIITEWYSPPETPNERFKVNAYILGRSLRSDGIKVTAFRQKRNDKNEWEDVQVTPETTTEIENAILTKARQLRISLTAP